MFKIKVITNPMNKYLLVLLCSFCAQQIHFIQMLTFDKFPDKIISVYLVIEENNKQKRMFGKYSDID